jgi:DNA-binding CsgD family transcriptional regulator
LVYKNKKLNKRFLQEQIDKKNRALVSKSIIINEKQSLLNQIEESLSTNKTNNDLKKLTQLISHNISQKDTDFISHFNEVYPGFYKTLQDNHPDLTKNELKICGYCKMNLTTKEIAKILNINPDSVQKSKYRIKKKINLNKAEKLDNYILSL